MVGDLPAQRARTELPGAALDHGGGNARPLAIERRPLAEADEEVSPPVLGVHQCEMLERPARLAGIEQGGQLAGRQVVRDPFVLEHADRDRVGVSVRGVLGRRSDIHDPAA